MRRSLLLIAGLLGLVLHPALTPAAQAEATRSVEEIETIIRDYLLREPEIVYEAIQELQRRQEQAEKERRRGAIAANRDALLDDERDPVMGDAGGDVTLVEFFDYRCGYCRRMAPELQALIEEDDRLRFVAKEFPILGPQSEMAARAALAADRQGSYEAMHFRLMSLERISDDTLRQAAEAIGLDAERLFADMESRAIDRHIEDNLQLANALGINGTPSFVIGDELIPGAASPSTLAAMIEAERGEAGAN